MSDIKTLTGTLIKIQQEEFLDIPANLITEIMKIQDSYSQNKSEAMKKISKIIEEHLNAQEFE